MITAMVQARMGSSRLPGKILMEIEGKPLIWHVLRRVKAAKTVDQIVVATTASPGDEPLRTFLGRSGVRMFLGSETDVLDRFYQAARDAKLKPTDALVRITPDDPFKDPEVIDRAVHLMKTTEPAADYVSNCSYDGSIPATYPEGIDIEVLTFACLEKIWKGATRASEREHLTPYLFRHRNRFKMIGFQHPENLSHLRWTIDYEKDMAFAREIYRRLYPSNPLFLMKDILALLTAEPELSRINTGTARYEGYRKSVEAERKTAATSGT